MEKELEGWWQQIQNATGHDQRSIFVRFCIRLVELKEEGKLSIEEASYKMVGAILSNDLTNYPECEAIFNIASIAEVPNEGPNVKLAEEQDKSKNSADKIKQKEWSKLVDAIEKAKVTLELI